MGHGWGCGSGGCGSRGRAGNAPMAVAALIQTQVQMCISDSPECAQQGWEQGQGWEQRSTQPQLQPSTLGIPGLVQPGMHCMQLVSSPHLSILEGNPFNCSCGIRWLQLWQNGSRAELGNQSLLCWEGSMLVALDSHPLHDCGMWHREIRPQQGPSPEPTEGGDSVGKAHLSSAEPPTARIEHPDVVLRQGDSVNLTCHIWGEPSVTGEWVLPHVGSEPSVTKARLGARRGPSRRTIPLQHPLGTGCAHPIPVLPAALGVGACPGDQQHLLQPQPQGSHMPGRECSGAGRGQRDAECHL